MNRLLLVAVSLAVGLAAGYWLGLNYAGGNQAIGAAHGPSAPEVVADNADPRIPPAGEAPPLAPTPPQLPLLTALDNRDWYALERQLAARTEPLPPGLADALVSGLQTSINKYDAVTMRRILRLYLELAPDDAGAWFLLSDLHEIEGMPESALDTLFTLLNGPFSDEVRVRARRAADRLVDLIDTRLRARGALNEREAFWRHVSASYNVSDFYRYHWAKSLAALERWASARSVLAQTGDTDVSQATLDELALFIEEAEQGLEFRRVGDRLISEVSRPGGHVYTLLVDTGANVTSLSIAALRGLQARRLADEVRVHTAGGVVATAVYTVPELEVQGRLVTDLRVLELPVDLPGLDGLLGTDVLDRLNWSVDNL